MAQTTPPTITPAPPPAIRGTPSFKVNVDGSLTWLATAPPQFQALAANVYANAVDAFGNATSAAASAATATIQATAAAAGANAPAWVSGTTYAAGNTRYGPSDFRTYRCIAPTAGAVDPSISLDWRLISPGPFPYAKFSDRKTNGTSGGNSVTGLQTRTLNTVITNSIGAVLSSSQITIPAGTYNIRARAPTYSSGGDQLILSNITDANIIEYGSSSFPGESTVCCQITLSSAKTIALRHYITNSIASGLGLPVSSGFAEVYAELEMWKVA